MQKTGNGGGIPSENFSYETEIISIYLWYEISNVLKWDILPRNIIPWNGMILRRYFMT